MYKVTIADVAELTEEILKIEFDITTPSSSDARSSDIGATLTIVGRVAYDANKDFMKNSIKEISAWSMVKPDSTDTYKEIFAKFNHTGSNRSYKLSHAFVIAFHEFFEDQNGYFQLVVRQKKDRLDGVAIE